MSRSHRNNLPVSFEVKAHSLRSATSQPERLCEIQAGRLLGSSDAIPPSDDSGIFTSMYYCGNGSNYVGCDKDGIHELARAVWISQHWSSRDSAYLTAGASGLS